MYPIEKYGWIKENKVTSNLLFFKEGIFRQRSVIFVYHISNHKVYIDSVVEISLEELQAIYETAEQIRKENE